MQVANYQPLREPGLRAFLQGDARWAATVTGWLGRLLFAAAAGCISLAAQDVLTWPSAGSRLRMHFRS